MSSRQSDGGFIGCPARSPARTTSTREALADPRGINRPADERMLRGLVFSLRGAAAGSR